MVGIALVPLAGSLRRRPAPAALGGFAALLVPILFSLAALVVLVVGVVRRPAPDHGRAGRGSAWSPPAAAPR